MTLDNVPELPMLAEESQEPAPPPDRSAIPQDPGYAQRVWKTEQGESMTFVSVVKAGPRQSTIRYTGLDTKVPTSQLHAVGHIKGQVLVTLGRPYWPIKVGESR